jgi:hypothetical protein
VLSQASCSRQGLVDVPAMSTPPRLRSVLRHRFHWHGAARPLRELLEHRRATARATARATEPDQERGLVIELHLRCALDLSPPPGAGTRLGSARRSRPAAPAPSLAYARYGRSLRDRLGGPVTHPPAEPKPKTLPRPTSKAPLFGCKAKALLWPQTSPGHRLSLRPGPPRATCRSRRPTPRSELRSSRGASCIATPAGVCGGRTAWVCEQKIKAAGLAVPCRHLREERGRPLRGLSFIPG